jgi:D-glycero-alpha-D-manno-heptose-7-phosphate kinase
MSPFRPTSNGDDRRAIVTQAPCRADLAGSTLDLWPLYLFHPGAVTLNFAVSIMTSCRITPLPGRTVRLRSVDTNRQEGFATLDDLCRAEQHQHPLAARLVQFFRPEGGFELETRSASPAGAGIAGSSALMIATTSALARFTGRKLDREQIRVTAQNVEAQLINVPTGCQDYYPALYGGVNAVHLDVDGIHREALPVTAEEIEARFLLVYTGAPRQSGINNWEVFKAHIDGDRKVVRNFEQISQISRAMHAALLASPPPAPGKDPVIHVFAAWPREWAGEYTLLARGAFLVTSALRQGKVEFVEVRSQAGNECRLRNPWGAGQAVLYRNGRQAQTLGGELLTFPTAKDETILLLPEGGAPEKVKRTVMA